MVNENKGVCCLRCGVGFENDEAWEKHTFHVNGDRWCGIMVLRFIEQNPDLAKTINERYKEKFHKEGEEIRRRRGW